LIVNLAFYTPGGVTGAILVLMIKKPPFLLILVFFSFLFLYRAIGSISTIPFHDYDEAHRAEGARNMRLNNYYTSPLVGTPQSKTNPHSQDFALDKSKKINPEVSRPPLVFSLMAFLSGVFGDYEWAYRLPSFIFGLLGFVLLIYFIKTYQRKPNWPALVVALLSFLTNYDWWHSALMAHLDTAVALFTSFALFLLLIFAKKQEKKYLLFSGFSLGLAVLSKGPPAILFIAPLPYLLIKKKIKISQLLLLFTVALVAILPWLIPLSLEHGWDYFFTKYFGGYVASPQTTKIGANDPTQSAPIFWYLRWWFDTFRPGVFLFGALLLIDLIKRKFNWVKISLLSYIVAGFGLFSYAKSKVWWYVLPVIPAVCAYLYFAVKDYLADNKNGRFTLSLAIIIASLPLLLWQSNTIALAYGFITTALTFLVLNWELGNWALIRNSKLEIRNLLFILVFASSFSLFYLRFPTVKPFYPEVKEVGQYYQTLEKPKCLWLEEDFPYEAILYYSKAGKINYLEKDSVFDPDCQNYLVANKKLEKENLDLIFQSGPVRLYDIETISYLD